MLDQITPVILTCDEEPNIARTLGQLSWAREVVVVDSFSVDATPHIARAFPNVRLIERTFDDYAQQWTAAVREVRTPWILALDADYFLSAPLIAELERLRPPSNVRGYRAAFRYAIGGRPLRASLYPPRVVLSMVDHTSFWLDGHTHRIAVDGSVADLKEPIIHDDRKSFARFVERQKKYMRQEAEKLRRRDPLSLGLAGRVRRLIVVAPLAVVFHSLFVKGLILDGFAGLRYTWERFVAELILSRELLRRRRA